MAEYIEREALMNVMLNGLFPNKKIETEFDVLRAIEKAPTADVVEVRHGVWKDNRNGTFTCSVCGGQSSKMDWCGRCGAKMDGKGDGE